MKMLVGLLSFALSFAAIASNGESKTFTYDGTQNSVELMLRGEKTHTEYRYENRNSICYRTEVVGYRTVCSGGPSGPRPGPRPPQNCYRQPIYRTVSYPCIETVRVSYEVKDFDVDARVIVDVTNLTGVATSGEKFVVKLHGDDVSIQTVGSKKFFLMLKKQDLRANMNGSVKFIDGLYAVEMIESAPVLKALKMTNISIKDSVLSFGVGPLENRANVAFSLNILKKKIGSDDVLFDRELTSSEISISTNTTGSAADVNVQSLGVNLNGGKYSLTAKAFFKADGVLMNASQFSGELEASRTLIYKIR